MEKKTQFSVGLRADVMEKLNQLAEQKGVSKAAIVALAISNLWEEEQRRK